ncbi:hypothetical protein [Methanocalculus chunghsingensis]|uniref:hypothetical protein n=1 Tax=Methanocalculus chunghsingensis TaxID=156457 RepID=UPI001B8A8CB1|nr:hypothetical protein [Methanocalculus chunghsingensis]
MRVFVPVIKAAGRSGDPDPIIGIGRRRAPERGWRRIRIPGGEVYDGSSVYDGSY